MKGLTETTNIKEQKLYKVIQRKGILYYDVVHMKPIKIKSEEIKPWQNSQCCGCPRMWL